MCKGADVQKQTHSALNGKGSTKSLGRTAVVTIAIGAATALRS